MRKIRVMIAVLGLFLGIINTAPVLAQDINDQQRAETIKHLIPDGGEDGFLKNISELVEEYRKKNMPYRTFLGDHAVSQNTLCVVNDHRNYLPWAPAINKKSYTYINGAVDAKIIREPRWPPPFAGEEGERRVDIEASLNNILDPTLEALIIGNKDFSEWDNLVKALKKAGAEDLERMYNESQARMESVSK